MIKGLLFLLAIFCTLVGLLVFAKSRPAPSSDGAGLNVGHQTVTVA